MTTMSISLWSGEKYWRVGVGVDKELGETALKKVIETIEQSLRGTFPDADMPRRRAVRKLFREEDE